VKVLITGGAGFIGSHLLDYHMKHGDTVYVIDNLSTGQIENIKQWQNHSNFYFYNTTILQCKELAFILEQVHRIYHFAAVVGMFNVLEKPVLTLKNNINSLEKMSAIIATQKNKPLMVVASSSEVYGDQQGKLSEKNSLIIENSKKTHATYPISKMVNEATALAYFKECNIPCIVLRIFNTVGPRQTGFYGMVVPRFIRQALKNEPITIFSDGSQKRTFCDVRDSINLMMELIANPNAIGEVINLGNEQLISILELAQLVKATVPNCSSELLFKSYEEVYKDDYIIINERIIDTTKLHRLVSYRPQFNLKDSIHEIIESFS